jgi:hypothetical protein
MTQLLVEHIDNINTVICRVLKRARELRISSWEKTAGARRKSENKNLRVKVENALVMANNLT